MENNHSLVPMLLRGNAKISIATDLRRSPRIKNKALRAKAISHVKSQSPSISNRLKVMFFAWDLNRIVEIPRMHSHAGAWERDKGLCAIDVNKNWRIVFKFQDGNAYIVDYENYH